MKQEDVIKTYYITSHNSGVVVNIINKPMTNVREIIICMDNFYDYESQIVNIPYVKIGEHVEFGDVIGTKPSEYIILY